MEKGSRGHTEYVRTLLKAESPPQGTHLFHQQQASKSFANNWGSSIPTGACGSIVIRNHILSHFSDLHSFPVSVLPFHLIQVCRIKPGDSYMPGGVLPCSCCLCSWPLSFYLNKSSKYKFRNFEFVDFSLLYVSFQIH